MPLVSVRDVCQPREDVLSGKSSLEIYAANLSQVVQGKAPDVYQDPTKFFENTYPTDGLKTTVKEVFSRLSDAAVGSPVIKLETSLGGGKTHTLIALYHLAKLGSKAAPPKIVGDLVFNPMQVVAIVGTDMGTVPAKGHPSTLWGELARQLGRFEVLRSSDEARSAPGENALRRLFGPAKTLVLIDEIALYLVKASAASVGGSTLARQTVAFLQELSNVAASMDNVSLVITSLDKRAVFADQTEELTRVLERDVQRDKAARAVQEADEVVSRVVRNLTPTRSEEFPNVVRHRLFKSYNRSAGVEVCKQYHASLKSDGVREALPKAATEGKYLEYLQESYPFHPELMSILRHKTSSITQFNQTRGVLRLLGLVVRHVWDKQLDTPLIHPYHIDFRVQAFREELISRLDKGEYASAVSQDISDERGTPRASLVDEEFSQPLGTWLATTAFLHSLTAVGGGDLRRGANEAELQLALHEPGLDPKAVERALGGLEDRCFYLVKQGSMYAFNTEPNLNQVIERAKEQVEGSQVLREVENRVQQVYGGRKYFSPCIFANEPSKVPDDTEKPKLVVVHWHEATIKGASMKVPDLVDRIFHESGTQGKPRIFANNVLFLLVDEEEKEKMEFKAREYLALRNLYQDIEANAPSISVLSKPQRDKIREKRNEAELFLKVAVVVAHKHVFVPTTQKDLESRQGKRPLRKLAIRVTDTEVEQRQRSSAADEEYLVTFLRNQRAARTVDDDPLSPDFVLDRLWPKNTASLTGDEFKKAFYKNPAADLLFSPELVTKAEQAGVKEGKWYGILGPQFFDRTNAATFAGAFSAELQLVLVDTDAGRTAWLQFNCEKCKRRRTQCVCAKEAQGPGPQPPPQPPQPVAEVMRVETRTLGGISEGLKVQAEDREVEHIIALELMPKGRDDLARLALAFPQFHGADVRFDLDAVLNKEHVPGGSFLRVQYRGDLKGFQEVKPVLLNYDAKEGFSMATLKVTFKWAEGLDPQAFLALLNKVANFTGESIYTAAATPKGKDGAKGAKR